MGSNASKGKQPEEATLRKSALKNNQEPPQRVANDTTGDTFGTETFRPNSDQQETSTHRLNAPVERSVPRVHYEDEADLPRSRNETVIPDTERREQPREPRQINRTWLVEEETTETVADNSPRQNQPRAVDDYRRGPVARRPYRQNPYQYRSIPPSIYPHHSHAPGTILPYNDVYPSPRPVDGRYRPMPIRHHSPRIVPVAIPISEQPPPYHAIDPVVYRNDYQRMPRQRPPPIQRHTLDNTNSEQYGDITDRSGVQQFNRTSYRDIQVTSLLSSEYLEYIEPATNSKPKSEESVHERDDDEYIGANLKFYRNQMKFRPNGETIDYIHKYWYGNYSLLETLHTYIQWLFPLYEGSRVNMEAVPLRAHEAKHIDADPETRNRFLTSFLMMLDFYGLSLVDEETGKIERAANWNERFNSWKRSGHNYTRITRILKSLGEMGQSHLQTPFVMALFHEVFETHALAGIQPTTLHHWLHSIKDEFEREYVYKQFQKGFTRLEEERPSVKRRNDSKVYSEKRKTLADSNKQVKFKPENKHELCK